MCQLYCGCPFVLSNEGGLGSRIEFQLIREKWGERTYKGKRYRVGNGQS